MSIVALHKTVFHAIQQNLSVWESKIGSALMISTVWCAIRKCRHTYHYTLPFLLCIWEEGDSAILCHM